jgi:hypothetical protein
MAKRFGPVRAPETAQIRLAVAARDHDSECPIRRYASRWIDQFPLRMRCASRKSISY